jgi:hypothetical protein
MKSTQVAVAIGTVLAAADLAPAQQTKRVSLDSSGAQANRWSMRSSIAADGRRIAFESGATNLVASDTNALTDIFVRDLATGVVERVSVDSSGAQSNGGSEGPALSADGNVVAFFSFASNLVAGDNNGHDDVFARDLATGVTELVSVDSSGNPGNDHSYRMALSTDGRFVAFESLATNLVASDTNSRLDVFVRDRATGTTERISVDSAGAEANGESALPSISADGRYVAFYSYATNLVAGDTNAFSDVFVRDRATGTTERVSVDSSGAQGDGDSVTPALSADGNVVAFFSRATTLVPNDTNFQVDLFVHDRTTGTTERDSVDSAGNESNNDSGGSLNHGPALSADGRFVAFESMATNLIASDGNGTLDVFVRDRASGATNRVSVDTSGAESDDASELDSMTADGGRVSFSSVATNLVAGDTNGCDDVFVRDQLVARWSNYGAGLAGTHGVPAIAPDQDPVLGATITVSVDNSRGTPTAGLLFLGFQRAQIPTHFGGDLLVVPALILPITFSYGADSFTGTLPSDPAFAGFAVDLQVVEGDPGAVKGVSFTAGLELVLGY